MTAHAHSAAALQDAISAALDGLRCVAWGEHVLSVAKRIPSHLPPAVDP